MPQGKTVLKVAGIFLAIVVVVWVFLYASERFSHDLAETNPLPTSSEEAGREFFQALQQERFQKCYKLLASSRKAATIIGKQDRQTYYVHFTRIRLYLTRYCGPEFADKMEVTPGGREVEFPNGVVLTVKYQSKAGSEKKSHFGIYEIEEFPIDIAPGIGIEEHNRMVNRMIDDIDSLDYDLGDVDNFTQVIQERKGESPAAKLSRWIKSYELARQLDSRHYLVDWIAREFPEDRLTRKFLAQVANNEKEAPHLRSHAALLLTELP